LFNRRRVGAVVESLENTDGYEGQHAFISELVAFGTHDAKFDVTSMDDDFVEKEFHLGRSKE
jgi:hypothetical protein